jgi:hypothetical protein
LFYELGDKNARRAYRMKTYVFWRLCDLLRPQLDKQYDDPFSMTRIPNGPICHCIRISITLRYLAGGQTMDIALVHGVSHSEVFESLWMVIDAINKEPSLIISFPDTHTEQTKIADGFKKKSQPGFSNCCGAIEGVLVWIHKPSKKDVSLTRCG